MELREYAERVLLGASLGEKLVVPGALTDVAPGAATRVDLPGRPAALRFPVARIKDRLPSDLSSARARGELLHRFANHELLALEIMAAVLLAFPEAPPAFRLGLARTMVEEQRHLALYLRRMEALGVALGTIPVNDFFWRCATGLSSPYDYLLRVPLTLEQANLDFTRHWRGRFAEVGDQETVDALDVVYRDEIGHVRGGLALFRQWKDPALSDWDAWASGLTLPLSPARGRGHVVDTEGRAAAGFDRDWIDRIAVFGGSRGRPPDVWVFNPSCEAEVARGRAGATPNEAARLLELDLAPLLIFLARREDVVVTPVLPTPAWLLEVEGAGFTLPELVAGVGAIGERTIGRCVPWGWSPEVVRRFEGRVPDGTGSVAPAAYSKVEALGWRAELLAAPEPWLAPAEGEVCTTLGSARAAAARGWLLKAPFSTAGRDRKRGPLDAGGERWAERVIAEQGAVRAEPWRERVLDLSFHFDLEDTLRFVGVCRFDCTPAGQFAGTRPGRWLVEEPPEIRRFFHGGEKSRLRAVAARLAEVLGPRLRPLGVRGPVGVDAFVYRESTGALRLDPLVEVNPRWTMGRVSLMLERRLHPHAQARWSFSRTAFPSAPIESEGGLLRRGVLPTNDPATARAVFTALVIR